MLCTVSQVSHMATLLQEGCKMKPSFLMLMYLVEYSLTKEGDNEEQSMNFITPAMDTTHVTKFTLVEMPNPVSANPSKLRNKTKQ